MATARVGPARVQGDGVGMMDVKVNAARERTEFAGTFELLTGGDLPKFG